MRYKSQTVTGSWGKEVSFTGITKLIGYKPGAAAAKSLQSCPTLCDPMEDSPPGSPIPGILQARTREWVAISFSNAWKWKVKVKSLSRVRLFATPWTAAYQAPPSMGFSRQECWSGVPFTGGHFATWSPFHFHALEKKMATHSNVLAWRIPGTAGPGGLLSMGLHRVRHDWSDLAAAALLGKTLPFLKIKTNKPRESNFLSWKSESWIYVFSQIKQLLGPKPLAFTGRTKVFFGENSSNWSLKHLHKQDFTLRSFSLWTILRRCYQLTTQSEKNLTEASEPKAKPKIKGLL